jgi:hypothetical protein
VADNQYALTAQQQLIDLAVNIIHNQSKRLTHMLLYVKLTL